jgi:flagellar basal-body rod protein FlgC
MGAQRARLQAVASNLANARTTRTEDGGPYQRKMPILQAQALDPFGDMLAQNLSTVQVIGLETSDAIELVHEPNHPDADENGYVAYPKIDILSEMVDMMNAARSYEANAKSVDTTHDMAMRALDIGR